MSTCTPQFLYGTTLSAATKQLLSESKKIRLAVAFWGEGAVGMFGKNPTRDVQIICNLKMGGTNPDAIDDLRKKYGAKSVKQMDLLHAKVYIGDDCAIISSANMSANGLGAEGLSPATWVEAGYRVPIGEGNSQLDWFNDAYSDAKEITDGDIESARALWKKRSRAFAKSVKETAPVICDYDFGSEDFPLMAWEGNNKFNTSSDAVKQRPDLNEDELDEAIASGIEVEDPNDSPLLSKNRWIVTYSFKRNSKRISWIRLTGETIESAFSYEGEDKKWDVKLADESGVDQPFSISDKNFIDAFHDLLNDPEFTGLRSDDYDGAWFEPREELMRNFWRKLQAQLCQSGIHRVNPRS